MSEKTAIEWTDHTFNIVLGCTKIAPECKNCYAATLAHRFGVGWGPDAERRMFGEKHWKDPLRWNKAAEKAGVRRRVFCSSMADVFEDHPTLEQERRKLWVLIERTPGLDWLLLTKRPENMNKMAPPFWAAGWPENVWAGTTAGTQETADKNIPALLQVPAAVRFVSAEPLLGPVDLARWLADRWPGCGCKIGPLDSEVRCDSNIVPRCPRCDYALGGMPEPQLHWIIVGGESGHGARPMHPDWARSLRDQCQAAGVAFFFKQWGEWGPVEIGQTADGGVLPDGRWAAGEAAWGLIEDGTPARMNRYGKKRAGRLLDGREWNEFPAGTAEVVP